MTDFKIDGKDFGDGRGSPRFILHENLFRKKSFVPDNKLTVCCEVKLFDFCEEF